MGENVVRELTLDHDQPIPFPHDKRKCEITKYARIYFLDALCRDTPQNHKVVVVSFADD